MTTRVLLFCAFAGAFTAAHADPAVAPSQAYRAVMKAQLDARRPPSPATPDEAQKIYDNYLQSIGKPLPDSSAGSQDNESMPSQTP